jgi:serine protease Do
MIFRKCLQNIHNFSMKFVYDIFIQIEGGSLMDTFENKDLTPEETPEAQTREETTAYHGEGIGQREQIGTNAYSAYHQNTEAEGYHPPYYQMPRPGAEEPWVQPKKKAGKIIGRVLCAILAIAVLAGGCTISSFLTAQAWQDYYDAMLPGMIDQAVQDAMQDLQIPTVPMGPNVNVTVDGFSASEIYEKNINSVVAVSCKLNVGGSAGTGFIISEDGYIVTNHHVIEDAVAVYVNLANGKQYKCEVKGSDATNDIAVLKADVTGLTPVTIGKSSEVKVGEPVVAIGNALGELSFSLTGGYISGTNREISTDGTMINMLQTDLAINSGNSGGPLFNARGQVIGITTAKYSGTSSSGASIEGIGFAIPIDDVIGMIADLRNHGFITGAYLGVSVSDVNEAAQAYGVPAGAYVHETVEGFCAAKAGMQAGDIIIWVETQQITSLNSLTRALRNYKAGDTIEVTVWREGRNVKLTLTLDEKPRN